MQYPETQFVEILKRIGIGPVLTLPCDRIRNLLPLLRERLDCLALTREEEGIGIAAGAAMAGRRPALVIQSSGMGNLVNALMSLTVFYRLPLAIFVSLRGVYKEAIPAQVPMGEALPRMLDALGIEWTMLNDADDIKAIEEPLAGVYRRGRQHVFLLSPRIWEGSGFAPDLPVGTCVCRDMTAVPEVKTTASLTRYEAIGAASGALKGNVVVCNLGIPSKELYEMLDQPSNFYMLGSMGMASAIGLGVAISHPGRVYVIDGDGSIMMNPGTLATIAHAGPSNLTIVAIDNASYGSTGNQPTCTGSCVDLVTVARGFGFGHTVVAATESRISEALSKEPPGPYFVHVPALAGNSGAKNIPLGHLEVRDRFMEYLRARGS